MCGQTTNWAKHYSSINLTNVRKFDDTYIFSSISHSTVIIRKIVCSRRKSKQGICWKGNSVFKGPVFYRLHACCNKITNKMSNYWQTKNFPQGMYRSNSRALPAQLRLHWLTIKEEWGNVLPARSITLHWGESRAHSRHFTNIRFLVSLYWRVRPTLRNGGLCKRVSPLWNILMQTTVATLSPQCPLPTAKFETRLVMICLPLYTCNTSVMKAGSCLTQACDKLPKHSAPRSSCWARFTISFFAMFLFKMRLPSNLIASIVGKDRYSGLPCRYYVNRNQKYKDGTHCYQNIFPSRIWRKFDILSRE